MTDRKRNVLIIIQTLAGGGAERIASVLTRILDINNNVTVVTFYNEVQYEYAGNHICVYHGEFDKSSYLKKIDIIRKRVRDIKRIKKEKDIDLSISHMPDADLVNVLSNVGEIMCGKICNNPLISHQKPSYHYFVRKAVLKRMDYIINPSKGAGKAAINKYNLNCLKQRTIYNTIDTIPIKNAKVAGKETLGLQEDDFIIVTMGNIRYEKGQWHLIKAFFYVVKEYPNIKLVLIGDGPLRKEIEKLVWSLNLNESVIFTGKLANPYPVLKTGDLFVFSSISESFGNAIVEAMAAGIPVISTDCNFGPREILESKSDTAIKEITYTEYGVLVPPFSNGDPDFTVNISRDEKVFSDAIIELIKDKKTMAYYSDQGKKRVKDFSLDKFSKDWNELISECDRCVL